MTVLNAHKSKFAQVKYQHLLFLLSIFSHFMLCRFGFSFHDYASTILGCYTSNLVHGCVSLFFTCLQFVVFYACSLDPENCAMKFATFLADVFMCRTNPPLTRYCKFIKSTIGLWRTFTCKVKVPPK